MIAARGMAERLRPRALNLRLADALATLLRPQAADGVAVSPLDDLSEHMLRDIGLHEVDRIRAQAPFPMAGWPPLFR